MDINCTLFVQMIHFFIAYLILRWLLFKPAIAIITQEQQQKDELISAVQLLEAEVVTKKSEYTTVWQRFHQSVSAIIPPVMQSELYFFSHLSPSVERHPLTPDQQNQLIPTCTHDIVAKVDHVH